MQLSHYQRFNTRRRGRASRTVAALVAAIAVPGSALGTLTHRYSFNDGTANDSVGAANGVLGNSATVSGGQLNLVNSGTSNVVTTGQYLDLPNNIAKTVNLTV